MIFTGNGSIQRLLALAVALGAVSCDGDFPGRVRTAAPKPVATPPVDTWARSLQCAENARRVIKDIEDRRDDQFYVLNWTNHYSPTFRRCFVHVSFFNRSFKTDKTQPMVYDVLIDALENSEVASCTRSPSTGWEVWCSISDGETQSNGDCTACRRFIDERLSE